MPIAEHDIGSAPMAETLRAGSPGRKRGIACIRQWCSHVFVGTAGILPIPKQRAARGISDLSRFGRFDDAFVLAVTDVAGVVVVAGVRVGQSV